MVAVRSVKNERESEMDLSIEKDRELGGVDDELFLDAIDFDDLLVDGDVLPDLETHHHHFLASQPHTKTDHDHTQNSSSNCQPAADSVSDPIHEPEPESWDPRPEPEPDGKDPESDRGKKSSAKKKNKVDWTAELHRRFVEAVEQLGIEKAVPSRILQIMGIDCLTRHNIASHLQKYRSHRKHVQVREAEAASWGRRRQLFGAQAAPAQAQRETNPWTNIAPTLTLGFPHFRPLHVWGHPSVDQSLLYTWNKHVAPPPPPHAWPPPLAVADPSFWHPHHQYVLPPGTPFFPPTRFPPPPAAGVPAVQTLLQPPADVLPSKESIDAAIGDVMRKPWLPLPLGLKPPSIDGVMVELRRQGVSKIPPT